MRNRHIWSTVVDDKLDAAAGEATDILKCSSPNAMTRIRSAMAEGNNNTFSKQLDLEHRHQSALMPANMLEFYLHLMLSAALVLGSLALTLFNLAVSIIVVA